MNSASFFMRGARCLTWRRKRSRTSFPSFSCSAAEKCLTRLTSSDGPSAVGLRAPFGSSATNSPLPRDSFSEPGVLKPLSSTGRHFLCPEDPDALAAGLRFVQDLLAREPKPRRLAVALHLDRQMVRR